MAVIIPVDFGNASFRFQLDGKPREYVITCGFRPGTGLTTPNTMANLLYGAFTSTGAPAESAAGLLSGYTFIGVTVTYQTATGPLPGEYVAPIVGTASAGGMPPNAAYLVRKATARGGKQGRGRMYCPPFNLSELSVDNLGNLSGGTIAALTSEYSVFQGECVSANVPLYLLHDNPLPPRLPPPPDPILSLTVEGTVATQRRRLRR